MCKGMLCLLLHMREDKQTNSFSSNKVIYVHFWYNELRVKLGLRYFRLYAIRNMLMLNIRCLYK